jgi:hypothetical protein
MTRCMPSLMAIATLMVLGALVTSMCGCSGGSGGGDGGGSDNATPPLYMYTVNVNKVANTQGGTTLAPGQPCVISGYGFGTHRNVRDNDVSTVSFNKDGESLSTAVVATTYVSWSENQIVCILPSLQAGQVYTVIVTVVTASGSSNSVEIGMGGNTVTPVAQAAISSITPATINAGGTITIHGTGFGIDRGDGHVLFEAPIGGIIQPDVLSWDDRLIMCSVPAGVAAGNNVPVTVIASTGAPSTSFSINIVKYLAIFVGINAYQDIPTLSNCVNDAKGMKESLAMSSLWGNATVVTLLDADATKAKIKAAIQELGALAADGTTFFFYFSGHGTNNGTLTYICPCDGDLFDKTTYISAEEFKALIEPIKGNRCIMLDSCYSGGFVGKDITSGVKCYTGLKGYDPHFRGDDFARQLQELAHLVFLGTCKGNQLGVDDSPGGKNSAFTYFVIEGLGGPADALNDRLITAEEVYDYSAPKASAWVLEHYPKLAPMEPQMLDNIPGGLPIKQ